MTVAGYEKTMKVEIDDKLRKQTARWTAEEQ